MTAPPLTDYASIPRGHPRSCHAALWDALADYDDGATAPELAVRVGRERSTVLRALDVWAHDGRVPLVELEPVRNDAGNSMARRFFRTDV